MATAAPASDSAWAIAWPMPLPAPVTSATLPSRFTELSFPRSGGPNRQLTAGRRDVAAARQPHRAGEAGRVEHGLERRDRFTRRAFVHPGGVVRDQVHLERAPVEERSQLGRVLG